MKIRKGNRYPFKIKKMLAFHGMTKGYFVRLAIRGLYSREYPHLDFFVVQRAEDAGFKVITLDENWINRNNKRNGIIVKGVWIPTNEDLNFYRLMFGPIKESEIYEF